MQFIDHDLETVKKYLLGQLTDDEQHHFEQRVLTEDDLAEELEVTTEELVEEYLANQLTEKESEWFEQHFLASPQGKRSRQFATTFHRYFSNNLTKPKKRSWPERLGAFLNLQTAPLRAVGALALVVIVAGVLWFSLPSRPPSYATLTLTNSLATRSKGTDSRRVKPQADVLKLTLMLPEPGAVGTQYRVEVMNERGEVKVLETVGQDVQSVNVEIPFNQLPAGHYAIALSAKGADGSTQRIRGSYHFTIE